MVVGRYIGIYVKGLLMAISGKIFREQNHRFSDGKIKNL